eukprot:COSAG02_NODE_421_length_22605_cov_158.841198_21_plen_331_part_00
MRDAEDDGQPSEADMVVFATILVTGMTCEYGQDACTNHAQMCIDCDAGGEADGDSCLYDETECTCPTGCTGDSDSAADESACSAVGGTWVAAGSAKTGCQVRESHFMGLAAGDGTEAAITVCSLREEGTGDGQCEGPEEDTGVASCAWSTDTCVPTAATTTQFTDAWTESKTSGMLAAFAPMMEAAAYDCSAGCTCTAADMEAAMAAGDSGDMSAISTECMACNFQAATEAERQACMTSGISATTCTAEETAIAVAAMSDDSGDSDGIPEGVSMGCIMCMGEVEALPEAQRPAASLACMTLTPCSYPDDVEKFDELMECNAFFRPRGRFG